MPQTSKQVMKVEQEKPSSGSPVWRPFDALRREADRLFDDMDLPMISWPFRRSAFDLAMPTMRPMEWAGRISVDVAETAKSFEIKADLPGFDEKSVDVSLVNGNLRIRAEREEEKEEKDKDYYLHERSSGMFERSFVLPESIDRNKIDAKFKNGVLTVTLPKTPEAQVPEKKIAVKAA